MRTSPAPRPTATRWRSELVTEVGVWLGQGIADLAAILDPEVVVIGGGVSKLGEMVLAPARDRLERALPGRGFRPGPRVVVAELGPQAGIVGAADLVRLRRQRGRGVDRRRPWSVPARASNVR